MSLAFKFDKMQPEKSSRMDTGELKAQLFKKVGQERFKRYFYSLNRFINQKLSKSEFDKSCYRILGRENLPLHNQIIRAILKNACSAKVPPPTVHEVGPTKIAIPSGRSSPILDDGLGIGIGIELGLGLVQPAVMAQNQSLVVAPTWSYGIVLPMSPRKVRSGIRDRKLRDRPSPLGPNGKADSASHQSTATEDSGCKTVENGDLTPCDYQRPFLKPENEERSIIKKPADVPVFEDGEEVEQTRSPLLAPLGIPFCSASTGGARKALPVSHIGDYISFFDDSGLSDSETLRNRMEQIASTQGVGGVTMECANTLNNMLDVYLKRLIGSCVELVGSRSTSHTSSKHLTQQQIHGKLISGLWPSNHLHMQEQRLHHSFSLLDFKVAMELNPQQLGEDWPSLLEKISTQAFEE